MTNLTEKEDWERGYAARHKLDDIQMDWRSVTNRVIANKIEELELAGKAILEVGAGDSQWLPYFATKHPDSRFVGIDYTKRGCERLVKRASALRSAGTINVYQEDMFTDHSNLHGQFDVVISFGVVEHFTDLSYPLSAKRKYLKAGGMMFTLIPNMAGSIGRLTKVFNRGVYETHNPHAWGSFLDGHRKAGLEVISGGYLGSTNFGVLSSCFNEPGGLFWHGYVFLTRLSKAIGFIESKFGTFPSSKTFSPYIYAVSRSS